MRKVFIILLLVFVFTDYALAGPFLVCDPQADILTYDIYGDGTLIVGDHPAQPDGSLRYELITATPSISFTATAKNVWGVSPESDPYISPSLAAKPLNLRLTE